MLARLARPIAASGRFGLLQRSLSTAAPLAGKVALVTGSTSGIGLSIAETLAGSGCNVVLNGFGDAAEIEALRVSITEKYGVGAIYNGADLTNPSEIDTMMAAATEAFGKVDILVNNAGIQHVSPLAEFPNDKWEKVVAINLSSAFYTTKACLPSMVATGYGRIINIASVHGKVASTGKGAYVAAKHGIIGLTKVTALETAGTGVTCVSVCPGWVLTPLVQKQIEARAAKSGKTIAEETKALVSEKMPSGEAVRPEDFGKIVEFLCSEAAAQITGSEIVADGAWTAQ